MGVKLRARILQKSWAQAQFGPLRTSLVSIGCKRYVYVYKWKLLCKCIYGQPLCVDNPLA